MIAKISLYSKAALQNLFVPLVIVLVGLSAFGLGRLSALDGQKETLKIYEPPAAGAVLGASVSVSEDQQFSAPAQAAAVSAENLPAPAGKYVASKNGTRYYLPGCSGAKRINEENKIWFSSPEAAQGAGFTPALNCPGL